MQNHFLIVGKIWGGRRGREEENLSKRTLKSLLPNLFLVKK